ncbi:MAG: MFS transporter [Burkholderiales bacterium]
MFIILPVFALYAQSLPGGQNYTLVGIALGAYGLTQALLQVAFGRLSDRWGRKPVIYLGLVIFAIGSFIAGAADDLYWVIAGRAIQGAGAISAAVIALTADLTSERNRTKAMAIIGMTIGATFALSMVVGPALGHAIGVPGIFAMTGILALCAILVVRFLVPDPEPSLSGTGAEPEVSLARVLRDGQLMRLNFGIFILHGVLMALFIVVPVALAQHLAPGAHWRAYLPAMLGSVAIMLPVMLASERGGWQKPAFVGAVALLAAASAALGLLSHSLALFVLALLLFFAAFNLLEASLPSLISKLAPAGAKGAAIGVYSTTQFLGAFLGAVAGGWVAQRFGIGAVYWFCAMAALAWLAISGGMSAPSGLSTRRYQLPRLESRRALGLERELATLPGVCEVMLSGDGFAYLKVDSAGFDEENVIRLIASKSG